MGNFCFAPEPWGVHVSQRNRDPARSPRLVELPDLARRAANMYGRCHQTHATAFPGW